MCRPPVPSTVLHEKAGMCGNGDAPVCPPRVARDPSFKRRAAFGYKRTSRCVSSFYFTGARTCTSFRAHSEMSGPPARICPKNVRRTAFVRVVWIPYRLLASRARIHESAPRQAKIGTCVRVSPSVRRVSHEDERASESCVRSEIFAVPCSHRLAPAVSAGSARVSEFSVLFSSRQRR